MSDQYKKFELGRTYNVKMFYGAAIKYAKVDISSFTKSGKSARIIITTPEGNLINRTVRIGHGINCEEMWVKDVLGNNPIHAVIE